MLACSTWRITDVLLIAALQVQRSGCQANTSLQDRLFKTSLVPMGQQAGFVSWYLSTIAHFLLRFIFTTMFACHLCRSGPSSKTCLRPSSPFFPRYEIAHVGRTSILRNPRELPEPLAKPFKSNIGCHRLEVHLQLCSS